MSTKIDLPARLYKRVQRFARQRHQEVSEAVVQLLEQALATGSKEVETQDWSEPDPAVEREMQAYLALHPQLKKEFFGQHVAIYGGQLVDHDKDYAALYARIDAAYPDEFVWLATVEEEPFPALGTRPSIIQEHNESLYGILAGEIKRTIPPEKWHEAREQAWAARAAEDYGVSEKTTRDS